MRLALIVLVGACLLVTGCGGESHQDLRAWMAEQGKGAKGKLDPLPQVKAYQPYAYDAFDMPDPFKPRKVEPGRGGGNALAPDMNRRREPLESFPLESLAMVGSMRQGSTWFALVRTPQREVYQVRLGNYMGQDYGVITSIADSEIRLKELVQDGAGDWSERTSTLLLQSDGKTQERK